MAYQNLWILKVPQAVEKGQGRKPAARSVQVLSKRARTLKTHPEGRPDFKTKVQLWIPEDLSSFM